VALSSAGLLDRPLCIDCICIPLAGHTLSEAFSYMGCLYSAVTVYSQVNWIDNVDDYLSRGWVMQELLLAKQILAPRVQKALNETIKKLTDLGNRILDVLNNILRRCGQIEAGEWIV